MNLKDRLIISKQYKENYSDNKVINGNTITVENHYADLIKKFITENRNIMFLIHRNFDKEKIVNYIKSTVLGRQVLVAENFESNIPGAENNIVIIKNSSAVDIVKIFEQNLRGIKPFVFMFDLENYENTAKKLAAVISVNFPNMTNESINLLIKASNPVCVAIEEDKISNISENIFENTVREHKIEQKEIAEISEPVIVEEEEAAQEQVQETEMQIIEEEEEITEENNSSETDIVEAEAVEEIPQEGEQIPEKVNKYKLLRDKIRSKKQAEQI